MNKLLLQFSATKTKRNWRNKNATFRQNQFDYVDDFCVVHESNANILDQDQTPTRVVKIDVELDEGSPKKGAQTKCRYFLEEINPNSILTHPNFILTS